MLDLKCVHKIYRVNTNQEFNLFKMIHLGKLYTHKPQMLKIDGKESKMLLFRTGKAILHGQPIIPKLFLSFLEEKDEKVMEKIEIRIVSMTFIGNFNKAINIRDVSKRYKDKCSLEPELFCGLVIKTNYEHVTANLFHNGKLVIMGCKSIDVARLIVRDIENMLNSL